jgi:uncharacterized repeat protein (TIGR01451 family)
MVNGIAPNLEEYFWSWPHLNDIVGTYDKLPGPGGGTHVDPHAFRIEVRPLEGVSSVRAPYLLIATVYDEKNQPRDNRRVEWMLEGAGHIIAVDESGSSPGHGYKVDNHFAVSYTRPTEQLLRPNKDSKDHSRIRPGQTWCVIASAVEGDSHVTVYCPEIENWENNKVLVRAQWVDAEWVYPPITRTPAGSQQVLTTTVVQRTDKQPVSGYRVRYRILGGPPAVFLPGQTREIEATSDLSGHACATLASLTSTAGVSRIGVEIIRPPDPTRSSGTGLSLARGETTVEWQAPVVSLDLCAPGSVVLGEELPYTITIGNTGPVASRAFTVRQLMPENLPFVRAEPPAAFEGSQLVWTLGELPAGQERTLQAVFRAGNTGLATSQVSAITAEGLRGNRGTATEITPHPQPQLQLDVTGPATAVPGGSVTCQVTLSNPGTAPARNIVLKGDLDAGLEYEPGLHRIETTVSTLPAGEKWPVPLTLKTRLPGPQGFRLTATADGGLKASGQHRVTVQEAALQLKVIGPTWCYAGRAVEWSVQLANGGEAPLQKVTVRDALPPELSFKSASDGGTLEGNQVVWNIGRLQPGEQKDLRLTTVSQQPAPGTRTVATAVAEPGLQAQAVADLEIRSQPALRLKVADLKDPLEKGDRTTYRIHVTNQGSLSGQNVAVTAVVPDEMALVDVRGPSQARVEERQVRFAPVAVLEAGATLTYQIEVETLKAGVVSFRAELQAATLPEPVLVEESTSIMPSLGHPGQPRAEGVAPARGAEVLPARWRRVGGTPAPQAEATSLRERRGEGAFVPVAVR